MRTAESVHDATLFWSLYELSTHCRTYVADVTKYRVEHDLVRDLDGFWFPLLVDATDKYHAWACGAHVDKRLSYAQERVRKMEEWLVQIQERAHHEPRDIHDHILKAWEEGINTCRFLIASYPRWNKEPVPCRSFDLADFHRLRSAFLHKIADIFRTKAEVHAWNTMCKLYVVLTKEEPCLQYNLKGESLRVFEEEVCGFWVPLLIRKVPRECKRVSDASNRILVRAEDAPARLQKLVWYMQRLEILRLRCVYERDVTICVLLHRHWSDVVSALKEIYDGITKH